MENLIADFRKKIGMTQEDLANKVGVARQTIISLEQGRYNPSLRLAYTITKILKAERIEDVFKLN
jgi:putative transcriptional regulator